MKIALNNKLEIGTFTTDKIKVIGSCMLLMVHPDTQCLKEVTFHITSHEGSVVLSCVTTLELSLIQPHSNLNFIPSSASLISSKTDYPRKNKFQKNMPVFKPSKNVCSSKEQSPIVLPAQEYSVNQCVIYEEKDETSKAECQANVISMQNDKNCQSTLCSDKNCQDTKGNHMQPVKPAMEMSSHMQLAKPAILQSSYKKSICNDKNCQSIQCIHMHSVTKSIHIWSVQPAMTQSTYKKFNQVSICNDKDCQSTKSVHMWKPAMTQTRYKMSSSKKCQVKSEGTQSSSLQSV